MDSENLVTLTADIVSAHVANNNVRVAEVGTLVRNVYAALAALDQPAAQPAEIRTPLVSARASIKPDFITCMACGRKQKTLRRHLMTAHELTPEQYRQEFGLPATYPMVAPNYSLRRRELAEASGLGKNRKGVKRGRPAKRKAGA